MTRTRSWIAAAAALLVAASAGATDEKLVVSKGRIRRGASASAFRLRLRARMPDPATYGLFQPVWEPLDFFVNGREILCAPTIGYFISPRDHTPRPIEGTDWWLTQKPHQRWLYENGEREVVLDLNRGTVTISADDAELADIVEAGVTDVTVTLQLGTEVVETVVDVRETNDAWRLVPVSPSK